MSVAPHSHSDDAAPAPDAGLGDSLEDRVSRKVGEARRLLHESLEEAEVYIAAEMERLQAERRRIEEERRELQEERTRMAEIVQRQEHLVELNVGGRTFTTSLDTLRADPHSMLAAMFSGRYGLKRDRKGRFFLDRDPRHFQTILNYLRTGTVVGPLSQRDLSELRLEAEFYGLDGLQKEVMLQMQGVHPVSVTDDSCVFRWTLHNYSLLSGKIESDPFGVGEHEWYLRFFPLGDKDAENHASLYLIYAGPHPSCRASFTLKMLNHRNETRSHMFDGGTDLFKMNNGWGKIKFFEVCRLNEGNGFAIDDCVIIEVFIRLASDTQPTSPAQANRIRS